MSPAVSVRSLLALPGTIHVTETLYIIPDSNFDMMLLFSHLISVLKLYEITRSKVFSKCSNN